MFKTNINKKRLSEPCLQPLTSTIRQTLSQRGSSSLAALTLLAGLSAGPASAATITVDANCTLVDAITAANSDTATGSCTAGSGADTIVLPVNSVHTLTAVNNSNYGSNGLPVVISEITIVGNGSTIQRNPAAPEFRIFRIESGGNLTLNMTTVSGGISSHGAGLSNHQGTVTLNNSTVSENSAYAGGGVHTWLGSVTFNRSTLSGNRSFQSGGGLGNYKGLVTLNKSTVSGNTADEKGGGLSTKNGTVTLNNSTVSGNSAAWGGGLYDRQSTVSISNSTIVQNTSYIAGGGIASAYSSFILSRTLVSGNSSSRNSEIFSFNSTISADDHNLFGHDGNAGIGGFNAGASDIVPSQGVAAIFAPLADNGGLTKTHLLVAGSPAINASPQAAGCPKNDQRGIRRPQGASCDIGAVEVTSCDIAIVTTNCTVNGVPNQSCEGTDAADTIIGTRGNDIIRGLGGNDILKGGGGDDKLCGGAGNDRLDAGSGLDQLFGGFGADKLLGGDDDDTLFGEQDNDNLDGGLGADKLNGGPGRQDTCTSDADDTSVTSCEL